MRLGKFIIENYKGYTGRYFSVRIINKFGGSSGYYSTSLLKVFLWLIHINRI